MAFPKGASPDRFGEDWMAHVHRLKEPCDELYAIHFNDNRGTADEHLLACMGAMSPDEILHALTDSGYRGAFTFEADSALRPATYRLGDRRRCPGDKRLASPTLEMQIRRKSGCLKAQSFPTPSEESVPGNLRPHQRS